MQNTQTNTTDTTNQQTTVRAGSLYGYHGTIVRANQLAQNGKRHVSIRKQLHGFVNDGELQPVSILKKLKYMFN